MRPLRRTAGVLAAVLTAPGLALAGSPPAAAAPAAPPAPPTRAVTLITGDVVELTAAGDRTAATVRPAPGRDGVTFHTLESDDGLRVLPSDVVPLLHAGRLDADLFDVERLLADGYGDATTPTLPLIVQGGAAGLRVQRTGERRLPSLDAVAFRAGKESLAGFWQSRAGMRAADAGRIWLDGRVRPVLDRSTAQIGAPTAWQAGLDGRGVTVAVLDTGVDQTHPDLVGRVTEARNFSESADAVDRHGHGTHVASTVAGTGAASAGRRKGVAPGAGLLVGKVLDDSGSGYESSIVEGMQWAADAGARVVNLSLGGDATDGTDPMSAALNDISARTGTLFVVAAGNAGGAASTVGSPGTADAALTVGAVDRAERIAGFSSRGPRLGDLGLKPEITAPGVGIVAARAAGTAMGDPVDARYTAANGTSMATPHVAGAAAVLAQQHPDWTAAQLKNALVSTVRTAPGTDVYAQGAGRVDVARAVTQTVTGSGTVDFGVHHVGETPAVHTRTVTYTNAGASPVTLTLDVPAAVTVASRTVTVPAGGTADVPVTLDLTRIDPGPHTGWLRATAGDTVVTTAVAATYDPPQYTVTVRAVDRNGRPTMVPVLALHGDDRRSDVLGWVGDGAVTYRVLAGDYLLHALVDGGSQEEVTLVTNPELRVDRDIEVLLDARTGTPIRIETPRPAEQRAILSYYVHRVTGSGREIAHGVMHFSTVREVNVTPTKRVREGTFEFSSRWQLEAPMVRAVVPGVPGPHRINLHGHSPAYTGTRQFPLTVWGTGDVRGTAVLLPPDPDTDERTRIAEAAAAGAAAVLAVRPADWSPWTVWRPDGDRLPVPAVVVGYADGNRLLARAARPGASIALTLTTSSPYLYDVIQVSRNRVPERIEHRVTPENTMRITSRYAHNGGFDWIREQRFGWRPWQEYAWNDTVRAVRTPSVRQEWVSAGDSVWQHRVHPAYPWGDGMLQSGLTHVPQSYRPGQSREAWAEPVVRPATPDGFSSTRTGDLLRLRVAEHVDSTDRHFSIDEADQASASLWRDGALLAELPDAWRDVTTTPGAAGYELRLSTVRGGDDWVHGTRTDSAWTFRSGADGVLPLLQVGYDAPVDQNGAAAGGAHRIGLSLRTPGRTGTPKRTTLRAEMSGDDGATWRTLAVTGRDGAYTATVPAGDTPVSLRIHAVDRDGNAVTQTVVRAYGRR
ncbi:S8 family serine peptidase [Jidongwangia harbinensis]|uniref:S8 family serine peptidase n=1 Tax=Jidongwangia harbinensis TaxID=2878561 RepID=UPI001CD965F3|nr:S8 family serine peptidase [Jidongwangia harbinensis]MCA2216207.1 S8 family serine peptidase [Jidongwangia harbinensis]